MSVFEFLGELTILLLWALMAIWLIEKFCDWIIDDE